MTRSCADQQAHLHLQRVIQDGDWILWRAAIQAIQGHLPSRHSRITFSGDAQMVILFVADPGMIGEGIDLQVIHVTGREFDSSQVIEPHPCVMPQCQEGFEHPVTALRFYAHMEDEARLFEKDKNICSFGCQRGFINQHSLLRHYLSGTCSGPSPNVKIRRALICKPCSKVFPDSQTSWAHLTTISAQ